MPTLLLSNEHPLPIHSHSTTRHTSDPKGVSEIDHTLDTLHSIPLTANLSRTLTAPALLSILLCGLLYAYSTSGFSLRSLSAPVVLRPDIAVGYQHVFGKSSISWAQYSPYHPAKQYAPPPEGCEITQVNILQRHGSRYPTKSASKSIEAALAKLQSASNFTDPQLKFVADYTYTLGTDDLVGFGANESFDAGGEAFERYAFLVGDDELPFVRASDGERVVLSATNWTAGFAAKSNHKYEPVLSVVISEEGNDTLDDASCPLFSSPGTQTAAWLTAYTADVTATLNAGAPGAELAGADTHSLISLCAFESVANSARSPWCGLFEELGAFDGFEYWGDLDKYYKTGYGGHLGPVQGVGYINELLARLTDTPVNDSTSTNRTLDASPETFPLGRAIYADFSHDNLMVAVYAAMGLFPQATPLSERTPDAARTWVASRMVPFAGRMVVERMRCVGGGVGVGVDGRQVGGEYVRVLVNQAVQPLMFCGAGDDGLCRLDAFVESQAFARSGGNGSWHECFE